MNKNITIQLKDNKAPCNVQNEKNDGVVISFKKLEMPFDVYSDFKNQCYYIYGMICNKEYSNIKNGFFIKKFDLNWQIQFEKEYLFADLKNDKNFSKLTRTLAFRNSFYLDKSSENIQFNIKEFPHKSDFSFFFDIQSNGNFKSAKVILVPLHNNFHKEILNVEGNCDASLQTSFMEKVYLQEEDRNKDVKYKLSLDNKALIINYYTENERIEIIEQEK